MGFTKLTALKLHSTRHLPWKIKPIQRKLRHVILRATKTGSGQPRCTRRAAVIQRVPAPQCGEKEGISLQPRARRVALH